MNFNEYQQKAKETAVYSVDPGEFHRLAYVALGLCGEAGETAEKIKKLLRGDPNPEYLSASLINELGDVLWYLSQLATECGLSLDMVAQMNLQKLADRKSRGVLKGSGDER